MVSICVEIMFRRYSHVLLLKLTVLVGVLLMLVKCFEFYKPIYMEKDISFGFSESEIQQAILNDEDLRVKYKLTGIVLHWQRLSGVQKLVSTMLDESELFSEIIVWNNNPEKHLSFTDLNISWTPRVQIINWNSNIKDLAKYQACARASTEACFYVDDDWDIRLYARSLYASFLLEPTILHAITDQFTYFTNLMWTFFDSNIDLHTGFSWIGCGSVFSREAALQHLEYIRLFLGNQENKSSFGSNKIFLSNSIRRFFSVFIPQSDQFFSIWMNQIPSQFNGRLIHSEEGASSSFFNFDFEEIQYRASILAIRTLVENLKISKRSKIFRRQRITNLVVDSVKSPCSYTNLWIFFSNCLPIDRIEEIPFNVTVDLKRSTRKNLPNSNGSPYKDDLHFFEKFNTANAVDDDRTTCWKINRLLRPGDFFGVDFLYVQMNKFWSFTIVYRHSTRLQKQLEISISLDSRIWRVLPPTETKGIFYNEDKLYVTFLPRKFPLSFQKFRFVRFTFQGMNETSFEICEIYRSSTKISD